MKKRARWKLPAILAGATAAMFLAGYLIATRILFPPLPEPENGIVVPDLSGLPVGAAQERLRRLGLRMTETMDVPTDAQAPGLVVAQSPLAGQQLRELGAVRVGVSAMLPAPEPEPAPAPAPTPTPTPPPMPPPDSNVAPDTVQDTVSLSH